MSIGQKSKDSDSCNIFTLGKGKVLSRGLLNIVTNCSCFSLRALISTMKD